METAADVFDALALLIEAAGISEEGPYWFLRVKVSEVQQYPNPLNVLGPHAAYDYNTKETLWGYRSKQEAEKALKEAKRSGIKGPVEYRITRGPVIPNESHQRMADPRDKPEPTKKLSDQFDADDIERWRHPYKKLYDDRGP